MHLTNLSVFLLSFLSYICCCFFTSELSYQLLLSLKRRNPCNIIVKCDGRRVNHRCRCRRKFGISGIFRAAKDQARQHIHVALPEPLQITLKRKDKDEGLGQIS